jgi:nucleoid-associated protein YgaU
MMDDGNHHFTGSAKMRRTAILRAVLGLLVVTTLCVIICAPGCNNQEELQSFQRQNQLLKQRVEELENRLQSSQERNHQYEQRVAELRNELRQAMAQSEQPAGSVSTATTTTETTIYEVVEGDSLWKIAEEQLGDGLHYKEILALNPRITKQDSLAVGTRLNLPSIEGFRNQVRQ